MKPRPSEEIKAFALVNGRLAGSYSTTLNLSTGGPTADLIVLPSDPLTEDDPARLAALRPAAVIVSGKVVHGALA
jgi:hypothetical protein